MIFSGCREVFNRLSPIAPMQFSAAFSGRTNQNKSEATIERHRHQRRFPVARDTLDPDMPRVHGWIGLQIIQAARGAPRPRPQCSPIFRLSRLASVGKTDDASG